MGRLDRYYHGVLLINKPRYMTSHEAVMRVRGFIKQRRIGHTGTLDPLAEGLLVLCIGKATKVVQFLSGYDKTYEGEICLGQQSKTYDSEGLYHNQMPMAAPDMSIDELTEIVKEYEGKIKQTIPAYSAVRVNGERLYNIARRGGNVDLPERYVNIRDITVLGYSKPYLQLRITCSSGTYIRTLANDIGNRLKCGGYLSGLLRISVGSLNLSDAFTLREVKDLHESGMLGQHLLPFEKVLNYGAIKITKEFEKKVICGRAPRYTDVVGIEGSFETGDRIVLKNVRGKIMAVGMAEVPSTSLQDSNSDELFKYVRVLN
ncbi:MAG: tRNA pseudouridine(55) synthase TruB [candidate division Zixibacteria bacterium]|nr:tRNA pseudouridine(55) synthase TruB [candidate division Zixibacteria bacterium]